MTSTQTPAETASGCPVHHGYQPFADERPVPVYAELRAEEPVMFDERIGYWVVTRYDDIKAVFEDWETFSSENAQAPVRERGPQAKQDHGGGWLHRLLRPLRPGPAGAHPHPQGRRRRPSRRAATRCSSRSSAPTWWTSSSAMLARPDRRGDLVRDLAYDVPTITILTLIGADLAQVDTYKRWSDSRAAMTWGDLERRGTGPARAQPGRVLGRSAGAWSPMAHETRAATAWSRDLVRGPAGRRPDHRPRDRLRLLQPALRRPRDHHDADLQRAARAAGAPRAVAAARRRAQDGSRRAIDEVLRYSRLDRRLAPQGPDATPRSAGSPSPRAPSILLLMGSANRDEARFDDRRGLRHHPPQRPRAPVLRLRHPLLPGQHAGQAAGQDRPRGGRPARPGPAPRRPGRASTFGDNLSFRVPVDGPRHLGRPEN